MFYSRSMTDIPEPGSFIAASRADQAVMLLRHSFRDPREPVSLKNVAFALANASGRSDSHGVVGGQILGGGAPDPEILRIVSEAWQILEQSRAICIDPQQTGGGWWLLTHYGEYLRDSSDPIGEIGLRLPGITS